MKRNLIHSIFPSLLLILMTTGYAESAVAGDRGSLGRKPLKWFSQKFMPRKYGLRISTDAGRMRVTVQTRSASDFQIFLFDGEGNLVMQRKGRCNNTEWIAPMERGHYFYEVFVKDERIDNGQLAIK